MKYALEASQHRSLRKATNRMLLIRDLVYIRRDMLPGLDIRQLQCLVALVEEKSVTAAGRRMNLSQPRMSNTLRRLREICDDPLLVRTGQTMQPTDRALDIARHVRASLAELAVALDPPEKFDPARSDRTFTLMLSDYVEVLLIPEAMRRISEIAPSVRLRLRPLETDAVRHVLDEGTCDIAFGFFPHLKGSLRVSTLLRDETVFIARDGLFGANAAPSLDEFLSASHVVLAGPEETGTRLELRCDAALEKIGKQRHVSAYVPTPHSAARIVAASDMIGLLPQKLAIEYARWLPLRWYAPPMELGMFDVSMVWHERAHTDRGVTWLRGIFKELAGKVNAQQAHDAGGYSPER